MRRLLPCRALVTKGAAVLATVGLLFGAHFAGQAEAATQRTPNFKWSVPKWDVSFQYWPNTTITIVNVVTYDQRFINWLQDTVNNYNHLNDIGQLPLRFALRTGGAENCGDSNTWYDKIVVCGGGNDPGSAASTTYKRWTSTSGGAAGPAHFINDGARINLNTTDVPWWTWTDHGMDVVFCHEVGHAIGLWHSDYSCLDTVAPLANIVGYPTPRYPGLYSDEDRLREIYTYL